MRKKPPLESSVSTIDSTGQTGSIVIASNKTFLTWAEIMSDEAVALVMLDRLPHHARVVSLIADSYRSKEHLRVGAANVGGYAFE